MCAALDRGSCMSVQQDIDAYIASQPEAKQSDMQALHSSMLKHGHKKRKTQNPDVVKSVTAKFSQFAEEAGHSILQSEWEHSIKKTDLREQYYFEVTHEKLATIFAPVDKVRLVFQNPLTAEHENNSAVFEPIYFHLLLN